MYANSSIPKSIDWRKEGAVTPVKNQQQVCLVELAGGMNTIESSALSLSCRTAQASVADSSALTRPSG